MLYDLQKEYGLNHPVVIQQSMVLDELINLAQYNKK
ncbi:aspartyl-phosphate phosphatase Spo0E family protein [Paenibacillus sp. PsM32]|nr:aspartyl-phosphate phosphatase Spo0E family protein [Paenibacillus sp. PsM32]MDN4620251.1 aspartyl-phosphate phosphatase Spo0E family protein [Paenibacillus sp. PsM32]